ncbi:MAG: BatD family protein [Phocaeicola sp.]
MKEVRKLVLLLIATLLVTQIWADDKVTFTAAAPDAVVAGDQFRLTYTVNTQKIKDFRAPTIKGFDVLMGPSRSQQSSTQIINGTRTSTSSITFTYILMATEPGDYTIPGASIQANGESALSNSVKVKVLPPDQSAGGGSSQSGGSNSSARSQAAGSKIGNQDLFVTATASKTTVFEQEAILLTYKVYTLVDLRSIYPKMPDWKGFHTQEVDLPQQKTFSLEHYNGKNYNTTVWSQHVLFPQHSGKLEIPAASFEATVAQRATNRDPFDAFFNGGSNYVEVKKTLVTPKLEINVKQLPAGKPATYSGAVGNFTLTSSINKEELMTNDAVTIKLVISGTGNMKLIGTPEVKFPQDFEIYDPKIEDKFNLTRDGLSGNKVIEYLAIPRHAGNFTIPPIEFTFFDLKSGSYKTLKSDSYTLKVAKGTGSSDQVVADFTGATKEDLRVLGKDIRYIKTGDTSLTPKGYFFFGSMTYLVWYIIPALLFLAFVLINRKQAAENANVTKTRTKRANKVAIKRMKSAQNLLKINAKDSFYDEVLKALWGYISDKLNMPVSQLSKENIEEKLTSYGADSEVIKDFISALNECEFARYAPGDQHEAMDKVYAAAIEVISKMENSIKK